MNKTLRAILMLLCVLTAPFLVKAGSSKTQLPSDPKPVYYNLFKDIFFVNLNDGISEFNEKLVVATYDSYLVQTNPIIKLRFYGHNIKDSDVFDQFVSFKRQLIDKGVLESNIKLQEVKDINVATPYFTIIVEESSLSQ